MIYLIFLAPPLIGVLLLFAFFRIILGNDSEIGGHSKRMWKFWLVFSIAAPLAQVVFALCGGYSDISGSVYSPIGTGAYGLIVFYLSVAIPIFSFSSLIFLGLFKLKSLSKLSESNDG